MWPAKKVLNLFEALAKQAKVQNQQLHFVDPAQLICDQETEQCYGTNKQEIYYFDDDHLSQTMTHRLNTLFKHFSLEYGHWMFEYMMQTF